MSDVLVGWLIGLALAMCVAVAGSTLLGLSPGGAFLWGAVWGGILPPLGAGLMARR